MKNIKLKLTVTLCHEINSNAKDTNNLVVFKVRCLFEIAWLPNLIT